MYNAKFFSPTAQLRSLVARSAKQNTSQDFGLASGETTHVWPNWQGWGLGLRGTDAIKQDPAHLILGRMVQPYA